MIKGETGDDLLPKIILNRNYSAYKSFYNDRVEMYRYPIIHSRMTTFGIFDDFIKALPKDKETILIFIDYTLTIAEEEYDTKLINAVSLLHDLCFYANDQISSKKEIYRIKKLRDRVQRLTFISNSVYWWNSIIRFLVLESGENKNDFLIKDKDYLKTDILNFPFVDHNEASSCPMQLSEIVDQIQIDFEGYKPLIFKRSALIDQSKYWIWDCRPIDTKQYGYLIFITNKDNEITIDYETYNTQYETILEEYIIQFHFRV